MSECIVIGGGPNGLAAAIQLAQSGHQVQLLEARDTVGGLAASEEFHPGFRSTGVLHDTERVQPWVIDALRLENHGLRTQAPPPVSAIGPEQSVQQLPGDEITAWHDEVMATAGLIRKLSAAPPPPIDSTASPWALLGPAVGVLKLGRPRLMDLLRVGPLCLQDWLDEWFSDPVIQGGVSLPALLGTWMGPRSPTGAAALLFSTALAGDEVVGGPAGLVDALKAAAIAAGVNLKTKAQVQRIRVEDGKVAGVSLTDGSYLAATNVLSSIGARKTLLELVDPTRLPFAIERAATPIRLRGIVAKVDLALEDWSWGSRVRIAPSMRYLEKAFDAAKHRRMPEAPGLDIRIPSLEDPGLAPNGQYVASVLVYGAAHDLDGGWTDAARARLGEVVCETMERFLPGSSQKIIAQRTRSPADLEQDYGLEGGHIFHGELGLDQILSFRPHPSLAGYTTPVLGLVLGGAGMHPAGGLTCAQGVLAAQRVR